ncbi:MAG: Hsp20/alpha crystallin family protein [Halioglobus sp.]|nr:Hsp20/alpha crystallin family protein [Halioglobus sp.]
MPRRELAPWRWGRLRHAADQPFESFERDISLLQREMDQLTRDFWDGAERFPALRGLLSRGALSPQIDETEDEKGFHIKVDLPGMDENDVEVSLSDGLLTIKGEKKQEQEEEGKEFYRKERSFGAFRRTLSIPAEVNEAKIAASFKKGVLSIDLPKSEEAKKKVKRIAVKAEA